MIKTWQQRCEEHPDHDGIVSEAMIQARMQEEIDELRATLEQAQIKTVPAQGRLAEKIPARGTNLEPIVRKAFDRIYAEQDPERWSDQEPVAWVNPKWLNPKTRHWTNDTILHKPIAGWIPLYTAPRQWQGLTDEDREEILRWVEWKEIGSQPVAPQKLIAYVEAKLREKNS